MANIRNLRKVLPKTRKGSHFWRRFTKGSHFGARSHQKNGKGLHFWRYRRRCAAGLGEGFALLGKFRIGFALLGIPSPKTAKGSQFSLRIAQASYFWTRARRTFERVRIFKASTTSCQKVKIRAVTFHHKFVLKFDVKMKLFGRSCGGALLVQVLARGFEVLA